MVDNPSKLTKRQRKALAHRTRHQNKHVDTEENDVPELDIQQDHSQPQVNEAASDTPSPLPSSKKRKHPDEPETAVEEAVVTKKRKAVSTATRDGDARKPRTAKSNRRYILFVGNLSYKTKVESIAAHFTAEPSESRPNPNPPQVRLLTQKVTPGATPKSRTKGCAFLEFPTASSLQAALKLHHSELDGRRINVELTAGGGGAGEKRREKVVGRNKKLMEERLKSDPTPRPPANYGLTNMRHSTTSGSAEAPAAAKTWTAAENDLPKPKKSRGAKKSKMANEPARPPSIKVATGANATPASRIWGGEKT